MIMQLRRLILGCLLPAGIAVWPLASAVRADTTLAPVTTASFQQMEKHWSGIPDEELLRTAQAGNAQALYFYWARVTSRLDARQQQLQTEINILGSHFPPAERGNLFRKWGGKSDVDLDRSAKDGDLEAQFVLDHKKADQLNAQVEQQSFYLEKSAELGFAPAVSKIGGRYLAGAGWVLTDTDQFRSGEINETNIAKGLEMLREAADAGWPRAQAQLGNIYLQAHMFPADLDKAIDFYRKAADQGHVVALYQLAKLYASGRGAPRGASDEPVALLHKAAEQKYTPALHDLAEHYRIGLSVPVDYVKAARYYEEASRGEGDFDQIGGAIYDLVGPDLEPKMDLTLGYHNFAKAASAYLKATLRLNPQAMSQIGRWYMTGYFVPRDPVAAYQWFDAAAKYGDVQARKLADGLKSRFTPGQSQRAAQSPLPISTGSPP